MKYMIMLYGTQRDYDQLTGRRFLPKTGDDEGARRSYVEAAGHTTSSAQQRYLHLRAARLS